MIIDVIHLPEHSLIFAIGQAIGVAVVPAGLHHARAFADPGRIFQTGRRRVAAFGRGWLRAAKQREGCGEQ